MAYDEGLAHRVYEIMSDQPGFVEKKMFGGVGYMLHGNMACGVNQAQLVVRAGPENYKEALAHPHTNVFDITGRPMTGWVLVEPSGIETDDDLKNWVERGIGFALSLPPK